MHSTSGELIANFDSCERRGFFETEWKPQRLHPTVMVSQAMFSALSQTERSDVGELAGENVIEMCANRGLNLTHYDLYGIGVHHACIADILSTFLVWRQDAPWRVVEPKVIGECQWTPSSLMDANGTLHRIALVDHWNDGRELAELHSWKTTGDMAVFRAPMVLHVFVLGASRGGKRHSAWTKGLLHPKNRKLRFEKKHQKKVGFQDTWYQVWREDHDQITREQWLEAMDEDRCFDNLAITLPLTPPTPERASRVIEILKRKAERLSKIRQLPDPCYSACDGFTPCPFQSCCFGSEESTPEEVGNFLPIAALTDHPCSQG